MTADLPVDSEHVNRRLFVEALSDLQLDIKVQVLILFQALSEC